MNSNNTTKHKRYAIGDVHGCKRTFEKLLFDKINPSKEDEIFLVGDLIDRGPDSKGVVDTIIKTESEGYRIRSVRGNHEQMLLDFYDKSDISWFRNGADGTLESFDLYKSEDFPGFYYDFFSSLPYYILTDGYVIVHAGINTDVLDPFSDKFFMLWSRDEIPNISRIEDRRIVTGHSPVPLEEIRKSLGEDKIMIDNGCVYKNVYPNLGALCAIDLDSLELIIQNNIDMETQKWI